MFVSLLYGINMEYGIFLLDFLRIQIQKNFSEKQIFIMNLVRFLAKKVCEIRSKCVKSVVIVQF